MKFAIFEFEDQTCEIGETLWIVNEDESKFTNDLWLSSQKVVVQWPKDFGKVARKLGKMPIKTDDIASTFCTATIVKFNGKHTTVNTDYFMY